MLTVQGSPGGHGPADALRAVLPAMLFRRAAGQAPRRRAPAPLGRSDGRRHQHAERLCLKVPQACHLHVRMPELPTAV